MSNIAVRFEDIVFSYSSRQKEPTIKNASFDITQGDYVCIVGGNGSGKSTISKIIVGILKPQHGKIYIFNNEIKQQNIKILRNNVGIIFQNPDNQFVGLTTEDDIAFGLENRKVNPTKMWDIIKTAAGIVNIKDLLSYDAARLSGGQKQRVAIASVLAMDPKIIIFDEATSMLDPTSKIELKKLMILLKQKFNKTIISVTHDMEEIINADKVLVINSGRVEKYDKPEKIFENEEFLKNNKLAIPFSLELSKVLREKNKSINLSLDRNKLVKQIGELCKK